MSSNLKAASLPVVMVLVFVSCAQFTTLAGTVLSLPFSDDFESGLSKWTAGGSWGVTPAQAHSPTYSVTDSPGAYYTNDTRASLTMAQALDLSGATHPAMAFWHMYSLEAVYDVGVVEVSLDEGASWSSTPLARYTGSRSAMIREQIDLTPFATQANVLIRFRLETDSSVILDGWYLDDVRVAEAPAAVILSLATNPTPTSVSLAWTASDAPNFASYRIYRSLAPNVEWHNASLVAEITSLSTLSYKDGTVSPKTPYYYKVMVLDAAGMHALSAELSAITPAGMDFPFFDNGEGGAGTWRATPPWALSSEEAFSGTTSWSDSPGCNYTNGIASQALTLVSGMVFTNRAVSPVLCFVHKYVFAAGDSGNVEISANNGQDWTLLRSYTGSAVNWGRQRLSLVAYTNSQALLIRFRLTSDSTANADGWHLDDVAVGESPDMIPAPVLDQVTSTSIRVNWSPVANDLCTGYAIYRSTATGVGLNSTLAGIVSRDQTNLTDAHLDLDTVYYYRVYSLSSLGLFSPDSTQESSARTLNNPVPLVQGFEDGVAGWKVTGSWAVTTNNPHSGNRCITESPGTLYNNSSDSTLVTAVNLTGTTNPVLRFWDRYQLGSGDWCRLEVSSDGGTWANLYGLYTGENTNWTEHVVDLTNYRGQPNVRIRFHFWSDASVTGDGWHLDDIQLSEYALKKYTLPFFENFENGLTNWLCADWGLEAGQPFAGNFSANATPNLPMIVDGDLRMWLNGELDLTNAVNPQLTYWLRGSLDYYSYFVVYASADGGYTWAAIDSFNYVWSSAWQRRQISLAGYANKKIRLIFRTWSVNGTAPANDIVVDNISVQEMPPAVVLSATVPHLRTIDLTWTASTLAGAFKRYEVYRSTGPGVSLSSTLIGVFTDAAVTSLTDTDLSIGSTYYYRLYVVDSSDTYVASNERSTTTVPLPFPLTDGLETRDQWMSTGNWGAGSNAPYAGSGYLTESPGGDYPNSHDGYVMTAVNLAGTTNPVLRFWDRFQIGSGDWCRLEVSSDGGNWANLYGQYTGENTNWTEHVVDLTNYRGQTNVRIRFHFWSDASGTRDGWAVDQVSVEEYALKKYAIPFFENFENGLTNWLCANWGLEAGQPFAGNFSVNATPNLPMIVDGDLRMWLNGEIDLTNAVNPQFTYWLRGSLDYYSHFVVYASADGGYTWAAIDSFNYVWSSAWQRRQISLAGYANKKIRLIFRTWSVNGTAPANDILVDNISVQEPVPAVSLLEGIPHLRSIDLNWSQSALGSLFKRYEVYRSTGAGVSLSSTLIGMFTNATVTSLTDTNLLVGSTYYYKVFAVDSTDTYMPSNERYATTVPRSFPGADEMDSMEAWTATGNWGVGTNSPLSGTGYLTESPVGDYPNSHDSYVMTAITLAGTTNPVLRFSDRFKLASGDWCRLEVSADGGNWANLYGQYTGENTNWTERAIDLTGYRGQPNVRIRFHLWSDGSGTQDGWAIDKFLLEDRPLRQIPFPFFENFENGLTNWLCANWGLEAGQPFAGNFSANATPNLPMIVDGDLRMWLNGELDLTNAVNPQLTYWLRGSLDYYSYFVVYASADGGYTWAAIDSFNYVWSSAWQRRQISLAGYANKKIRLIFRTWSVNGSAPANDIVIDNLGIGEWTPSAPSLNAPAQLSVVAVNRPTLTVDNALSYQGSSLSYRFEVYSDASLSTIAAQVPVVASGTGVTAWQVDVDLPNNAQFWWRCRATSGTYIGPWMATASFFVNQINTPPDPVLLASGKLFLADTNGVLTWYPTRDPDMGDTISFYRVQVSLSETFAVLLIDGTVALESPPTGSYWTYSVPLNQFAGTSNLMPGSTYHWRVSAQDNRSLWSDWPSGDHTFQFGLAPLLVPARFTRTSLSAGSNFVIEWEPSPNNIYVDFSTNLVSGAWKNIAGPLMGTSWTNAINPDIPCGFYRLRSE